VSVEEALRTPSRRFFALLAAAEQLDAREALQQLEIATNPQLLKGQNKLWKRLERQAYPKSLEEELASGRAWLELHRPRKA